ncbi:MAG TPA: hypothetical protein VJP05_04750 [Acidimicrobiia bacterium]|nr:hypothetical protein [Acidimicrobiia bacterium]
MLAAALVDYLPVATTVVAVAFSVVLYRHWRRRPGVRYILWWMIGVIMFGLGTLTEAAVALWGWQPWLFRAWYLSGALLGGAPLAQGTVYLVHSRRTADRLAFALVLFVAVAGTFVLLTPVTPLASDPNALTGRVMAWSWIRLFTPFVNTYALAYLVGGAAWSAVRYKRKGEGSKGRAVGNTLIALGGLAPGIGGLFTRFGRVEVLFVTELIGLTLIWLGYRTIVVDRSPSVYPNQTAQRARR